MEINFNNSLILLFSDVTNAFWVKLDKSMKEIGLHSGQVFILISLWENDGQSQIELAKNLNLSPPTINKMIKSLGNNGFVTTRRGIADGRIVRVFLTEKGTEIKGPVEAQWHRLEAQSFAALTDTEKLMLYQLFQKLRGSLVSGNE